ncbi:MAG: hypothetical protein NZ555_13670 [Geminicoccaceae bacterium]|nr:hypothetical protein [Geminicoccaceae bacterium]
MPLAPDTGNREKPWKINAVAGVATVAGTKIERTNMTRSFADELREIVARLRARDALSRASRPAVPHVPRDVGDRGGDPGKERAPEPSRPRASGLEEALEAYVTAREGGDDRAAEAAISTIARAIAPAYPDLARAWWAADRFARTYRLNRARALAEAAVVSRHGCQCAEGATGKTMMARTNEDGSMRALIDDLRRVEAALRPVLFCNDEGELVEIETVGEPERTTSAGSR